MEANAAGEAGVLALQTGTAPSEGDAGAAGAGAADAGVLTVLVADDEPGIRAYVGQVLRRSGYNVLQAADGFEALELAAQHPGPIHLLLTDLSMPRLDGRELHRRLNHQRRETRTIFMSACGATGLAPDSAFLSKPFAPPVLVHKVNEVLSVQVGRARRTAGVG